MPGRLARLLLVACTVLGVAALHTIGHATADGFGGAATVRAATAVAVPAIVAGDTTGDGCDGDGCTHHTGPEWWEVCLAVLGALLTAGLAAVLLLRITPARPAASRSQPYRPPPEAAAVPSAGLSIARIAVLRT